MADLGPCSNATCLEAGVLPFFFLFFLELFVPENDNLYGRSQGPQI